MGIAIGIVLVAATVASFVMINAKASRMARQYRDDGQWTVNPQTGQPVPPQQGPGHHHGSPHHGAPHHGGGGHHGGGHFGGGHDGGGFSGGGGHHG
jgi:uncharacterized membrane protein YgcG